MARYFGMTTVWVENDEEEPYPQPEYTIESFESFPAVLERIQRTS